MPWPPDDPWSPPVSKQEVRLSAFRATSILGLSPAGPPLVCELAVRHHHQTCVSKATGNEAVHPSVEGIDFQIVPWPRITSFRMMT